VLEGEILSLQPNTKILIIGGRGFIGSQLVQCFGARYNVTILSQTKVQSVILGYNFVSFDYTEENFLTFLRDNPFDVIHFLSGNPHPSCSETEPFLDIELTIMPVLSILNALQKVSYKGSVWFASSVAVYGNSPDAILNEESVCVPLSNYGVAKLTVESYAKHYSRTFDLNIGVYRIFSTYGPGLKRQVIYDNILKMQRGEAEILLASTETSARDFSYVSDQASAIKFLSDKVKPRGDIFNIGSGVATKIVDLVKTIAELMEYKGSIECQTGRPLIHDVSWTADVTKISTLGFHQRYSLRKGLKDTIKSIIK